MKPLEFRAAKSLISNVDLEQGEELQRMIKKKITNLKTENIKRSLIEEFNKHDYLRKYVPLIHRITSVKYKLDDIEGTSTSYLTIKLRDEPEYKIRFQSLDGEQYAEVLYKRERPISKFPPFPPIQKQKEYMWDLVHKNDGSKISEYLYGFVETISDDYEINNTFPEYSDTITAYLIYDKDMYNKYCSNRWLH